MRACCGGSLLSKSFDALARENLTLLYLDFPQNPVTPSPRSSVQGLLPKSKESRGDDPASDGKVGYRRTGSTPGKAQDYFKELEKAVLDYGNKRLCGKEGQSRILRLARWSGNPFNVAHPAFLRSRLRTAKIKLPSVPCPPQL